MADRKKILIEVSNRHAHFSRMDLDVLFGERFRLVPVRELSQPGQFATNEKVDLIGSGGGLEGVRILGPERNNSQVELSKSDANLLGIDAPTRHSGDLEESPGIKVVGHLGILNLRKGVIISHKHLHASDEEANELGIKEGDKVNIRVVGNRKFILENVFVRKGEGHRLAVHIDRDEGDGARLGWFGYGELV